MNQYVGPNAVYPGLPTQTSLQQSIPSYVYEQYADDDNIQAFNSSFNELNTQFLLWFNTLNLPIYTGGVVAGALLDWVGEGLYGMMRPSVTSGTVKGYAATNTFVINAQAINSRKKFSNQTSQTVSDDIYRRVITWNFYKGDGFVFCMAWLKRRVLRFLNGANGIDPGLDQTNAVSATVSGSVFVIKVPSGDPAILNLLNLLIGSQACHTPFQYSISVGSGAGLSNDGGFLVVDFAQGWPPSPILLGGGVLWANGGTYAVVSVVPGVTPNPYAPPVYFSTTTADYLLELGGGNLPLTNPGVGTGQLWNNGGAVCIA
jgi:hypothetical protein